MMGCTIKLVGTAALNGSKDELTVFVSPMMVPLGGPLASARGPGNVVVVHSENLSESLRNYYRASSFISVFRVLYAPSQSLFGFMFTS